MTPRRKTITDELARADFRGLKRGDPVKVRGLRGRFVFMYASPDENGIVRDVTVNGGTSRKALTRCVEPERIIKVRKPKDPA